MTTTEYTTDDYRRAFDTWVDTRERLERALAMVRANPTDRRGCDHPAFPHIIRAALNIPTFTRASSILNYLRGDLYSVEPHTPFVISFGQYDYIVYFFSRESTWRGMAEAVIKNARPRDRITYVWDGRVWSLPRRGEHLKGIIRALYAQAIG
jgi:hypothetical protein